MGREGSVAPAKLEQACWGESTSFGRNNPLCLGGLWRFSCVNWIEVGLVRTKVGYSILGRRRRAWLDE